MQERTLGKSNPGMLTNPAMPGRRRFLAAGLGMTAVLVVGSFLLGSRTEPILGQWFEPRAPAAGQARLASFEAQTDLAASTDFPAGSCYWSKRLRSIPSSCKSPAGVRARAHFIAANNTRRAASASACAWWWLNPWPMSCRNRSPQRAAGHPLEMPDQAAPPLPFRGWIRPDGRGLPASPPWAAAGAPAQSSLL